MVWTRPQMQSLHNRRDPAPLTSYQLWYSKVQSLSAASRRQKNIWAWKYDNCISERVRKSSTCGNICSKTCVHPTNKVQETARIVFFFEMLLQYSASHQTNKPTEEVWEHRGWWGKRVNLLKGLSRRVDVWRTRWLLNINNFISQISEAQSSTDVTDQISTVNKGRQGKSQVQSQIQV